MSAEVFASVASVRQSVNHERRATPVSTLPDNPRRCPTCGALLNPEPDLRAHYRESQRDATGKAHLQAALVLGRFKCPRCGMWSQHALWEVSTKASEEHHDETSE